MLNSLGESLRRKSHPFIVAICLIISIAIPVATSDPLFAQCPSSTIQDSFSDIQVAWPTPTTRPENATVGMSSLGSGGAIIVAWDGSSADTEIMATRFNPDGTPWGDPFPLTRHNDDPNLNCRESKLDPSLAVSASGLVTVAYSNAFADACQYCLSSSCFTYEDCPSPYCDLYDCTYQHAGCVLCGSNPPRCAANPGGRLMLSVQFPFGSNPTPPFMTPIRVGNGKDNSAPSAGVSSTGDPMFAWANRGTCPNDGPFGWLIGPSSGSGTALLACAPNDCAPAAGYLCYYAYANDPQPCISVRSDGYFLVAWADPETPNEAFSNFNIKLQAYLWTGTQLTQVGGQVWVNNTSTGIVEVDPSDQVSPAVAMDDPDTDLRSNVVVTWAGPYPPGIYNYAVFARRFVFDPNLSQPIRDPVGSEGARSDFIVNNQSVVCGPLAPAFAHPTVALTSDPDHRGRFIIGWNSQAPCGNPGTEVHGQFFEHDGRPMGCEFRLHQGIGALPGGGYVNRTLAASARHTLAFGSNGNVAVAYTLDSGPEVWLTLIPATTAEGFGNDTFCCKGDVNRDELVNGRDIQAFTTLILNHPQTHSAVELCPADINEDSLLKLDDVPPFVTLLLEGAICTGGLSRGMADCNANGVPDANDLANGTSLDCNQNFIPDECDISEETSADVNGNGIPDECEPDCNHNGIPDAWDIAQHTSNDVDADGIPDECEPDCNANGLPDDYDIAQQTSADCNANGIPDECEQDCNANGVPDDCDTDPADPDGNGLVSPDCNANGWPDECDLAMGPPFGSLDCNENGVPDECDIASGYSQDVNGNQIPDECEGGAFGGDGPMQGGGETWDGNTGETPMLQTPEEVEAAWAAFHEWAEQQCWGPDCATTGSEQFQAYADKLAELGLPLVGAP